MMLISVINYIYRDSSDSFQYSGNYAGLYYTIFTFFSSTVLLLWYNTVMPDILHK